jgi:GntR family transcriptional regulator/MocR family aminotransferase
MAIQWAGLGPELLLRLDRRAEETLGSQLQRELREAIRSGRLSEGERLPSSRGLAAELCVSRGLVLECYEQLIAEGYLSAQPGSATRVAAGTTARRGGDPAVAVAPPPLAVDFRPGVPDLTSFPLHDWLWAVGKAARDAPTAAMGYGDNRGAAALREVLAAYLRRVRGGSNDAERVLICAGYAQGINLLLRALSGHGLRLIAFEDPGDRDMFRLAERAGLEAVPVPVDQRGVDVVALSGSGARAVVVTPAHQSPTGMVLAPERRQALIAWAREADAVIIEDEYDNEFRYDRQPVGSLQGLAPDRVASVGTVSKTLAPALRLGWIVCPGWLLEALAYEKRLADRGSPGLDQLALAVLIESGRYDRHLRHMRTEYAARRAALVAALARQAPGVELTGLAAGFHAVAHLPDGHHEAAVISAARERSIGLYGMSRYRANGAVDPAMLVLGFGNLSVSAITRGIGAIGDLFTAPRTGRGHAEAVEPLRYSPGEHP